MAEKSTSDEVVDAFNLIDEDGSGEVSHEEVSILGGGGVMGHPFFLGLFFFN